MSFIQNKNSNIIETRNESDTPIIKESELIIKR